MSLIDRYASWIDKSVHEDPNQARKRILLAYKAFGWYQKHFPDKGLPPSKQFLANASMQVMLNGFGHPENAALVSVFTPCEILQTFNLSPICAEMFSTYLNGAHAEHPFIETAEAAGISDSFCSYHKVLLGAARSGVLPDTKCIVNTSLACDANNLTFRAISHSRGIPQFYLDVPYEKSEDSVQYVANKLKELTLALSDLCQQDLDPEKLQENVERSRKTARFMLSTIPDRRDKYLPGTLTAELYEGLMMHTALGSADALHYAQLLKKDYEQAKPNTGKKILWIHTNPFWQPLVKDIFNEKENPHIIATELGYDNWYVSNRTDPYAAMAERLVYNPYNGPITDRAEKACSLAKEMAADGAVIFCHWGCKETCGASDLIQKKLEENGIPTLIVNGDGVDRTNTSAGQTETRLQAFMEMMEAEQ